MILARILTICLVASLCACSSGEVHFESPSGPLYRSVVLSDKIFARYSGVAQARFDVPGSLAPPIHDCHRAVLYGAATNSADNFRLPRGQASLFYRIHCLECHSFAGKSFTRKIKGTVVGSDLRGMHTHIHGLNRGHERKDRFGLTVQAGAEGVAEITEVYLTGCDWITD